MNIVDIITVRITQLRMRLSPETAVADDAEELLYDRCIVCTEEVLISATYDDLRYGFECEECDNFQHSRCIRAMD